MYLKKREQQMKSSHKGNNKQRIAIARGAICTFLKTGSSHGESNKWGITIATRAKCTLKKGRTTMVGTISGDQQ
jgi:hypothetical protein